MKTRNRPCTNPAPANGGEDCSVLGPDTSTMECNIQECPGKMEKSVNTVFNFATINPNLRIVNR